MTVNGRANSWSAAELFPGDNIKYPFYWLLKLLTDMILYQISEFILIYICSTDFIDKNTSTSHDLAMTLHLSV